MPDAGTVTIPNPGMSVEDPIVLRQENSYTGIEFVLGSGWSSYLNNTGGAPDDYEIYFTAKNRYTEDNTANIFDVQCTVSDQSTGTIAADLTVSNTDVDTGDYWWQIQIRNTDGTVVKTALTGKLIIEPRLRDVT